MLIKLIGILRPLLSVVEGVWLLETREEAGSPAVLGKGRTQKVWELCQGEWGDGILSGCGSSMYLEQ